MARREFVSLDFNVRALGIQGLLIKVCAIGNEASTALHYFEDLSCILPREGQGPWSSLRQCATRLPVHSGGLVPNLVPRHEVLVVDFRRSSANCSPVHHLAGSTQVYFHLDDGHLHQLLVLFMGADMGGLHVNGQPSFSLSSCLGSPSILCDLGEELQLLAVLELVQLVDGLAIPVLLAVFPVDMCVQRSCIFVRSGTILAWDPQCLVDMAGGHGLGFAHMMVN